MRNKQQYPVNWSDTIRPAALMRANYKCSKCKIKHRSKGYYDYTGNWIECDNYMLMYARKLEFKTQEIILQVHHRDGNRENNNDSNLQVLCVRCHLEVERELNKMKRKLKGIIYKK